MGSNASRLPNGLMTRGNSGTDGFVMHTSSLCRLGSVVFLCAWATAWLQAAPAVEIWLTDPAGTARFERQVAQATFAPGEVATNAIVVDDQRSFQIIDGFGYTLTGGSAQHLLGMSAPARAALLMELFATNGTGIGVSYLRLSVAASDLNDHVFSYNDLPAGETDPEVKRFSLGPDDTTVVPVLREILSINPELKLMGSPWSAPVWMKDNGDTRGGSLKPEWYGAYARYLVKYVQAMKARGIAIDALTVQNEPLHPGNNPSMFMPAEAQAEFIKRHLGPAFKAASLTTKIICYDHNADRPDYPITILNDPEAKPFVDGSAFHLYKGQIGALAQVHEAHPDKHLYFTEQWVGAPGNLRQNLSWHVSQLVVGATRNWCRTVLEWNLTSNPQLDPHTDRGGCDRCLGAVTIDGDKVIRNPAYYIIAHASKFVRPGSVRIDSTLPEGLPNVAFRTPAGERVVIVLNQDQAPREVALSHQGRKAVLSLPAGAAATCVWRP